MLFWVALFGIWCLLAIQSFDRVQDSGLQAVLPLGWLTIIALVLLGMALLWVLLRSVVRVLAQ